MGFIKLDYILESITIDSFMVILLKIHLISVSDYKKVEFLDTEGEF